MKLSSLADLKQLLPESKQSTDIPKVGTHDGKEKAIRIFLDTKGRKGKTVTIISGLQHNPATKNEIARILKEFCGCGGSVKEGNIELQGDQRVRAGEKMKSMNYVVK
jgi:translation initiation factor 1